jgi:hypothetical protein
MKTFPIIKEDGTKRAFEVENAYIGKRDICRILSKIRNVSDVEPRKIFQSPVDIVARFRINDKKFVVWEPYGDSSRYWIGEEKDSASPHLIDQIEAEFLAFKPSIFRMILGDIVELKFLKFLKTRRD